MKSSIILNVFYVCDGKPVLHVIFNFDSSALSFAATKMRCVICCLLKVQWENKVIKQSLYYIGMTNDILTAHSIPKSNLRLCLTLSLLKNIKVSIGRKQRMQIKLNWLFDLILIEEKIYFW